MKARWLSLGFRTGWILLFALVLMTAAGPIRTDVADAAPGNLLGQIQRPAGCFGGSGGVGVAMTPNGGDIYYTCQGGGLQQSELLFETNLSGQLVRQVQLRDASYNLLPMHALAWDTDENLLWGVNQVPTGRTPTDALCAVWRIDVNNEVGGTGGAIAYIATLAFTFTEPGGLCQLHFSGNRFVTGLAIDPATDTVYVSPAGDSRIRAFNKDGTPAANDPINFTKVTRSRCQTRCYVSGLAMGANGMLMVSATSDSRLFIIDPAGKSLVSTLNGAAPRNYDLDCGPMVYDQFGAPLRTILSADLNSSVINVLESPPGFCNPLDFVVRNLRVSPSSVTLQQSGLTIVDVSFEVAAFGRDPSAWSSKLEDISTRMAPADVRMLAEPGDLCDFTTHEFPGLVVTPLPCAEGDTAGAPSISGYSACLDGTDNDSDGLTDYQDDDCTAQVSGLTVNYTLDETFQTITRRVIIGACRTGVDPTITFVTALFPTDTNPSNNSASADLTVNCVP